MLDMDKNNGEILRLVYRYQMRTRQYVRALNTKRKIKAIIK